MQILGFLEASNEHFYFNFIFIEMEILQKVLKCTEKTKLVLGCWEIIKCADMFYITSDCGKAPIRKDLCNQIFITDTNTHVCRYFHKSTSCWIPNDLKAANEYSRTKTNNGKLLPPHTRCDVRVWRNFAPFCPFKRVEITERR